jgi:hypothetical protein
MSVTFMKRESKKMRMIGRREDVYRNKKKERR